MPLHRLLLSRVLNAFFARGLGLPVRDLSSGFRLYRARGARRADARGHELRGARGDPGQGLRRRVGASARSRSRTTRASAARRTRASFAFGIDLAARLRPPVEAAQLDRVGRLRRARLLQPHSAAALVAAPPPRDHLRHGARRRQDARHRLRLERDPADRSTTSSGSTSCTTSCATCAATTCRSCAARSSRCRCATRSVRLRRLLAGDRAHPGRRSIFAELRRVLRPGGLLILGTPDYATDRLADDRAALRASSRRAGTRTSTSPTTRGADLRDWRPATAWSWWTTRYVARSELIMAMRKGAA